MSTTKPKPATTAQPLHIHTPRPHTVRNPNLVHAKARQQTGFAGFNARLAVLITRNVGSMQCAYLFACIGIGSLVGLVTGNVVVAAVFGSISSYFLQLVLLPIISVGQEQMSQHAEIQSEEQFRAVQNTEHDSEQMMAHLSAQDSELLKQTAELLKQTPMLERILALLGGQSASAPSAVSVNGTSTTNAASAATADVRVDAPLGVASVAIRSRRPSKPAKPPTPQQRRSDPPDPPLQDS